MISLATEVALQQGIDWIVAYAERLTTEMLKTLHFSRRAVGVSPGALTCRQIVRGPTACCMWAAVRDA